MKKFFLLPVILIIFLPYTNSYGFDVTGLQPTAPYGVFSTFSAESLHRGQIALSADAEILFEPDFYRFLVKTAYGITNTIEFNMTIPYVHRWADRVDGFEDVALGLKHRFIDEGKYGPSIAYILNASIPSGRDEFSTDGRFGGGLIISKRVGPVKGHLNFFYEEPGKKNFEKEFILGAGLDFAAAHNVNLLVELYSKKSHDSKKLDSVEARFGYRIKAAEMIYTTIGGEFDLVHTDPSYRVMFSVTFISPHKKKAIRKVYEEEE